ncbi:ABC transporter permease [Undibacterium sp. Di24W]|uniref:ABC transporter permease n=1 Tax=Undibacterium sp. Di24W TaxID=3413033 RepID=UPI003BF0FD28
MNLLDNFWHALRLLLTADADLWQIIGLSLRTAMLALMIATPIALFCGYQLATYRFYGRRFVIWLIQASLSFPTVLIGLLLYLLLSRQGYLGTWHWLFSSKALVFGQALIALPILIAFIFTAVQACDQRIAETAISLGASPWQVMWTVLREARFAVIAAVIHAFGRVISEVGCAMMVGGNIAGETRTMTTAIALETSKGEFAQGIALGLVLLVTALVMNAILLVLQGDAGQSGRAL